MKDLNFVCPHCGCDELYIVGKARYTVDFHLTKERCVRKVVGRYPYQSVEYVPCEGGEYVHDIRRELGNTDECQTVRCSACQARVGLRRDYEDAGYCLPT